MRIALFTDSFLPLINGVTTYVIELAKKLADRGHRVYIIAPKFSKSETFRYPNVTVLRKLSVPAPIYSGYKFTLPFDPLLLKWVSERKMDVIHFHTPVMLGMQAVLIAKILDIPLIGTFHTFFMDRQYLKHVGMDSRIVEKIGWRLSNVYYNRCDLITCHSEGIKQELIMHGCKKPIKVIPLSIDSTVFDNSGSSEMREKLCRKGKILLFVGRLAHEKNIPYLLECFHLVLRKLPDTKLVIVGDGPQAGLVKAKIRALGISNSVIMTGKIEHERLVKSGIFGACDVFINASTTETGPLTILEAQVSGLVCVSVKGHDTNLIVDGVNGYLVEKKDRRGFAEAVISLLTDSKKYRRMKLATQRMVKEHELSRVVDLWEKTYKDVKYFSKVLK
jgi:1,2-diacylglycerol 3-alpha-glucosyltransferase